MNKKVAACVVACAFVMGVAGFGYAAKINCEVTAVEGEKVTMTCKDASKIAPGEKVKVASAKKGAVEGC
ncbi:MAG: hypothetical protein A2X81_06980 [Desulfobacterales bacterium GWB2_56_26]|nr:MAG: hypothetical protein A2X81_06980 [Desulfobacterales bacterium GWB2_56_26]HBG21093.1 hypothetical protein [Desulfobulbaceae bacterium]